MNYIPSRHRFGRLRVWHLGLLVLFVAIAIANIQDQRRREPILLALAAVGFVLYSVFCWAGWMILYRYEPKLGWLWTLIIYLIGISILFLISTLVYLKLEQICLR